MTWRFHRYGGLDKDNLTYEGSGLLDPASVQFSRSEQGRKTSHKDDDLFVDTPRIFAFGRHTAGNPTDKGWSAKPYTLWIWYDE